MFKWWSYLPKIEKSSEKKHKEIDWNARKSEFENILSKYRGDGSHYDCLIPVSGGKDSSALLILLLNACLRFNIKKDITVAYCDTNVEIPLVKNLVYETINLLKSELCNTSIKLKFIIARPDINDTFFVKTASAKRLEKLFLVKNCINILTLNIQRFIYYCYSCLTCSYNQYIISLLILRLKFL